MTSTRFERAAALLAFFAFLRTSSAQTPSRAGESIEHTRQGNELYRSGLYDQAIDEYKVAYELSPLPGLLFNLGQAYRQNGDKRDALAAYRAFLARKLNGRASDEARRYRDELERQIGADEATPAPRAAALEPEVPEAPA